MDWSKWLVTLQPAAILAVSGIMNYDQKIILNQTSKTLLILSLGCSVISLLAATFAMGGLPSVIERLPSTLKDEKGIYDMRIYWNGRIRVWHMVFAEHFFFVLAIIFLSVFLCVLIYRN
jgi:hypothetical protein